MEAPGVRAADDACACCELRRCNEIGVLLTDGLSMRTKKPNGETQEELQ